MGSHVKAVVNSSKIQLLPLPKHDSRCVHLTDGDKGGPTWSLGFWGHCTCQKEFSTQRVWVTLSWVFQGVPISQKDVYPGRFSLLKTIPGNRPPPIALVHLPDPLGGSMCILTLSKIFLTLSLNPFCHCHLWKGLPSYSYKNLCLYFWKIGVFSKIFIFFWVGEVYSECDICQMLKC